MNQQLIDSAYAILKTNDRGAYTVPTEGLYPFQWNWDSCLTALGFGHFDESRAWSEIQTLFTHQWSDGMVPHIVFHKQDDGYFPGPEIWQTNRSTATSGITQPPVAGHIVRTLLERAQDKKLAYQQAGLLCEKILAWHEWFYRHRDPDDEGLVAVIHPWETGRDNSVDWDQPLAKVSIEGVQPYNRRDTQHANTKERPTQAQYDRYIALVQIFRALAWDNSKLHQASPFKLVDPGFNAILIRSSNDMLEVANKLGQPAIAKRFAELAYQAEMALESLWSEEQGQYLCYDRASQSFIHNLSVAGILPIFATSAHAKTIVKRLATLHQHCQYLVPSQDPASTAFESIRYWRGPTWLIINYLIKTGLESCREHTMATEIVKHSLELIQKSGFAEYYDPINASPCGGKEFSWTAAMVIEFLTSRGINTNGHQSTQ